MADEKSKTNPHQHHKLDYTSEAEVKPSRNSESKIYFDKLPYEIVENILILATTTTRQAPETYRSLIQTCKKISNIPEQRKRKILPLLYLQIPDDGSQFEHPYDISKSASSGKRRKRFHV